MSYVLVTGASSGIGRVFARQLAARGENLIITARREERLRDLSAELQQKYAVDVKVIVADLSEDGVSVICDAIRENQWSISGLINNAGFGVFGPFGKMDWRQQSALLQVNIVSLVDLTYRLLGLIQQHKGAYICNVASIVSFQAGPGAALYYASKAFVLSFSEALSVELKEAGVMVSCLCPGVTATEFFLTSSGKERSTFDAIAMSAEQVVEIALKRQRRVIVITGFRNRLLVALSRLMPRSVTRRLAYFFNKAAKHN